jgi:hypothetical protein
VLRRARGHLGNLRIPEDHVAVQVIGGAQRLGPLVADQAGERAGGAAIVGGFRGFLHLLPRAPTRVDAAAPVVAAEAEARVAARVHEEEREPGPAAVDAAHEALVGGGAGRAAQGDLTEELRVVGHGGEVEPPRELHVSTGLSVGTPGLQADARAPGKRVGLRWAGPRALRAGIEGPPRVHVEVAEERLSQRIRLGARLALLGALDGGRATGRQRHEHADEKAAAEAPAHRKAWSTLERMRLLESGVS